MKKLFTVLITVLTFQAGAATLPLTFQTATGTPAERLVLADNQGLTLYTFTPDELNKSNCNAACAKAWPPALIDATDEKLLSGVLGSIPREDGSHQLTVSGQPVYRFAGDQAVGDINGEGLNGIWFVLDLNLVRKK